MTHLIFKIRNRHILALDIVSLLLIPALALTLCVDRLNWWPHLHRPLVDFTLAALLIKLPTFYSLGLYCRYWCYAGVNDLARVLVAVGASTLLLALLGTAAHAQLVPHGLDLPRSLPLIDGLLTVAAVCGLRFGLRGLYHWQQRCPGAPGGRRVLVVGAGEAGTMVAQELRANPQLDMEPVAFADDDPAKIGTHIHGLPVLGSTAQVPELVKGQQIQRIVVAMPSIPLRRQQEIFYLCQETGVATHNLPGVYEILAGHKTISRLPQIDIQRLLQREPIATDQAEIAALLRGATVLVTGAGGSIGSELCRQIARREPRQIVLLGHGENSIFEINLDLRLSFPDLTTCPVILDVRNRRGVQGMVARYRPQVIVHAAAHKHVHFMESNVLEAITTNVLGTRNVLRAAELYGVERLILISTDKAVNPTSVMGASKRIAEMLAVAAARRSGRAYMGVRFGNVLGSRGSVIPVFQRQIAAGGPLTVTHPHMQRYFMTIPEAVQLVLQAAALGRGGEIFVLDMGEPMRILDMATDLIRLCGLKPWRDIDIVFSGPRPGEKLNEELFLDAEHYQRSCHPQIFISRSAGAVDSALVEQMVIELINLAQAVQTPADDRRLRGLLPQICRYIDQYHAPSRPLLAPPPPALKPVPAGSTGPLRPRAVPDQA